MTSVFQRAYTERDGSEFYEYPNLTVEYRDASHRYWLHHGDARQAAVSVTSALKVLDKPNLRKWIEDRGAEVRCVSPRWVNLTAAWLR